MDAQQSHDAERKAGRATILLVIAVLIIFVVMVYIFRHFGAPTAPY